MSDPILSLKALDAHYGDFQALYGVDLHLNAGEVVAIIGANGAGKTTMMRSISGLMKNGAGQVAFRGQPIGALRADQVAHLGIDPASTGEVLALRAVAIATGVVDGELVTAAVTHV